MYLFFFFFVLYVLYVKLILNFKLEKDFFKQKKKNEVNYSTNI